MGSCTVITVIIVTIMVIVITRHHSSLIIAHVACECVCVARVCSCVWGMRMCLCTLTEGDGSLKGAPVRSRGARCIATRPRRELSSNHYHGAGAAWDAPGSGESGHLERCGACPMKFMNDLDRMRAAGSISSSPGSVMRLFALPLIIAPTLEGPAAKARKGDTTPKKDCVEAWCDN